MTPEPPPPGTASEMYLAAILDELRAIRGRLPEPSTVPDTPPPGTVELTEPAPPRKPAPRQQPRRKPS
ncbi:hypothetical protein AB0C10_36420 [Microbispora amethystogenes]|uniref:hypothetical protein n=1 Tax=Microbispora amethystogenes TaxID=1427754 RepID=UPI0033C91F2E